MTSALTLEQIIAEMREATTTSCAWINVRCARVAAILSALSEATSRAEKAEAAIADQRAEYNCALAEMATEFRAVNVEKALSQMSPDIGKLFNRATKAETERDAAVEERGNDAADPDKALWRFWSDKSVQMARKAETAERKLAEAVEALTPSADTKAAYIGEFSFREQIFDGDTETYLTVTRTVPWTTIKEIMVAIRARISGEQP